MPETSDGLRLLNQQRKEEQAERKAQFLAEFPRHGLITETAKAIGLTYETIRRWRQDDPEFATAVATLQEEWRQELLDAAQGTVAFHVVTKKNLKAAQFVWDKLGGAELNPTQKVQHEHSGTIYHSVIPEAVRAEELDEGEDDIEAVYRMIETRNE